MDNFLRETQISKTEPTRIRKLKETSFHRSNKENYQITTLRKSTRLDYFLGEYYQIIILKALKRKEILLVFSMKQV